ncbi:MAG: FecR domain-containing protein [Alistipes sp.]
MKEELLYRYLNGQATEQEKEEILAWLDADPEKHVQEMNRIHYICTALDQYQPQESASVPASTSRRSTLRKIGWYASSAAASILLLFGVWHLGNQNTYRAISQRMTTLEIPTGQRLKITLEDGTKVWLNAGAKLEYPPVFEKEIRNVKISGEALFEVAPNAQRPFVVETFASKIEVLGTKFNVFADQELNQFTTTLVEGRVQVTNLQHPSDAIVMQPHDVVSLINGRLSKSQCSSFADLCWTEGLIHIKKMPFNELMRRFEKAYDVKVVIDRVGLPDINVMSGEVRISDGIDYALHILQQVSDFTYVRDEKTNNIVIK